MSIKNTTVLEKVESEGTDSFSFIFYFFTCQRLSDRAIYWHDVNLRCQFLNTLWQGRPSEYQLEIPQGVLGSVHALSNQQSVSFQISWYNLMSAETYENVHE